MSCLRLLPPVLVMAAAPLIAQPILRPVPSGRATTEVTLAYPAGQSPAGFKPPTIRIEYGQPFLRGRTLHTDSLVPYDKAWRTGANASTVLKTQVPLLVGGAEIPIGDYVLFTIPRRSGWTLVIQKSIGQSTTDYDAANDLARVDLRRRDLTESIEALTFWLVPSLAAGLPRGELRFAWGKEEFSTTWAVKRG